MVNITDNKKVAQLVIEAQNNPNDYEAINPNSLANIIKQFNDGEVIVNNEEEELSVQDHINDASIHLTEARVTEITADKITASNIKPGENIRIDEDGNDIVISSIGVVPSEYLTGDKIVPADASVSIFRDYHPEVFGEHAVAIRANIPPYSQYLRSENIKPKDDTVTINYGQGNTVYIGATPASYIEGSGIDITNRVITNTMPDQVVEIEAGDNVKVESHYPFFKISAKDNLKVSPWEPYTEYDVDTLVTHNGGLFVCIEAHTSNGRVIGTLQDDGTVIDIETAEVIGHAINGIVYDNDNNEIGVVIDGVPYTGTFEPEKWEMLAAWSIERQLFNVERATRTLVLNQIMPSKDCLIVNIGGVMQSSENYDLQPDGQTLKFIETIPAGSNVEVIMMGNTVLNAHDETANVDDWESDTSYIIGNIVIYENGLYKCLENHISGNDFGSEQDKWELIAGYSKTSEFFQSDEPTSSITLQEHINSKNDIMINVGNTLLMSNNYELSTDGYTINFGYYDENDEWVEDPIEANAEIEVVIFGHAVLHDSQIPSPSRHDNDKMLKVNSLGNGYELITPQEVAENIGLGDLADYSNENNNFVQVKNDASGYKFISPKNAAGLFGVPRVADGLIVKNIEKDIVGEEIPGIGTQYYDTFTLSKGSIISNDGSVLIRLQNDITKVLNKSYEYGDGNGSMLDYEDEQWESPILSSQATEYSDVTVFPLNSCYNDREGWRAMDGNIDGNGWLSSINNVISEENYVRWQYHSSFDIKVKQIDFYNTKSASIEGQGYNNYSKNIVPWVADIENPQEFDKEYLIGDENENHYFTANSGEAALTTVMIDEEKQVYGNYFGLDVISSYNESGTLAGSKEIKLHGSYKANIKLNSTGYIYAVIDNYGSLTDIATSYKYLDEIENVMPNGWKYTLIGTFTIDEEGHIKEIYPPENLNEGYITKRIVTDSMLEETLETTVDELLDRELREYLQEFNEETVVPEINNSDVVLNDRIDTEVNTINDRIDTEVNTINDRINNEVNTKIDSSVEMLNNTINDVSQYRKRNYGEIVQSILPILDNKLHLLDGSLISKSGNEEFYNYMTSIYNRTPLYMITVDIPECYATDMDSGTGYLIGKKQTLVFYSSVNPIIGTMIYTDKNLSEEYLSVKDSFGDNFIFYPITVYNDPRFNIFYISDNKLYYKCTDKLLIWTTDRNVTRYETFFKGIEATVTEISRDGSLFATEEEWQSIKSTYGSCGKFVLNTSAQTVRLPKIEGFIEGTNTLSNIGNINEAGLPNIKGSINPGSNSSGKGFGQSSSTSGCISLTNATSSQKVFQTTSSSYTGYTMSFDASKSNSIYGKSSKVQPQSIKVLYYMVIKE